MFKNFTHKQKYFALIGGIVLFLLLSYQLSISKTIAQFEKLSQEKAKLEKAENAPVRIKQLQREIAQLNAQVGKLDQEFESFQERLLSNVVQLGEQHDVQIISVEEPHAYNRNGFEVQTAIIRLRGSFKHLTTLIAALEEKSSEGRLAATTFQVVEDKKLKKYSLETELHIQNFKKL